MNKNILVAFILNFLFSLFELFGGLVTNSISIISDAIHDMGDAFSIGLSYFLENISKGNSVVYKKSNILICIIGIPISVLGFSNLVNIIYPIFGMVGLIQIICILLKN